MIIPESTEASQEFIHELSRVTPDVKFDRMTRLLYSTDASIYQMVPIGVAFPRDGDQVAGILEVAFKRRVPVLPRGGGSSLAGQAVGHALVLDLSRHMDRILEIDAQNRRVRVQPGITLGSLNKRLKNEGLMYGPDPASAERATMGGVAGNNSTGAHSIVYGMTVDHVLELEAILANGERARFEAFDQDDWELRGRRPGCEGQIYREVHRILNEYAGPIANRYPRTFRTVAGYGLNKVADSGGPNLARLLVGSEGTLAVTTAMTLNLVPVPKQTRLAMVHFGELTSAMEAVPRLLESEPFAIEVIDRMLLDLTRDRLEYRRLLTFVEGDPAAILAVEYAGETDSELEAGIGRLRAALAAIKHRGPVIVISDPAEQQNVWDVRKVGLGILMSVRGDAKPIPFIEDAAVPVQHLADYISEIYEFAHEVGVSRVAMYAHASAGCIHVRPLVNLKRAEGIRQLRQIAEKSVELVLRYGGTTSGEHGEGLARAEFSARLFGIELVQAFREVKAAFDPEGLMNPGKVVNPSPMDDERLLRFGPGYTVPLEPRETALNFSVDGGFAAAVEMCNGAGVCRKLDEGVMCPSYRVTRDEAHSTRGRANALRAAMMGLLGPEGMTSSELHEVLDLCLSCQACKRECPSAVDMAKLKAEFLHGYHRVHGTPIRARILGDLRRWSRFGQQFAPLANLMLRGPARWLLALLGFAPERPLPLLATTRLSRWYRRRHTLDGGQPVVFFQDTFSECYEPRIGKAAIRVLEATGYDPILVDQLVCCGRPSYSKGLLGTARRMAMRNVELLAPFAEAGIPIVGVEPSCLSMLAGEYRHLVPGGQAEMVADAARPLEDFLLQEHAAGRIELDLSQIPAEVLYHGHCQEKANFGTEGTLALLKMIPGLQIHEIEAGCCGMAGSFGYEREHYPLSIRLAEMMLAPAVRQAPESTIICASGTSCRQQIMHTAGRRARHPIELLEEALYSSSSPACKAR